MADSYEYARVAPFYERIFGDLLYAGRLEVLRLCKAHELRTLLDVGCGTGEQGVMALSHGLEYMGIDQNDSMLLEARKRLPKETYVCHLPATAFASEFLRYNAPVDVVLCSLILHEMPYKERLQVLEETRQCARYLILVEYVLPERTLAIPASLLAHIPELLAGKRHYECFRDFMARGGVEGFLHSLGLPVIERSTFLGGAIRVVLSSLQ